MISAATATTTTLLPCSSSPVNSMRGAGEWGDQSNFMSMRPNQVDSH